ncbi:GcrA family cell cycle regulator [Aurantimonas coralicida]|uniref:GcrA family cell cycle regulator n=1 Tax=Aurantimonas coralicida TaxID=182270 RepID=UPI001D182B17|nr:GcrA family cell cycle regulator [Aurantimonas coralicida]MCC4299334.1 hypothetical protein [Aurantimonas coralicida]
MTRWSDDDITRAAGLWTDGASYAAIGRALGVSRNAIAGLVDRNPERFSRRREIRPAIVERLKIVAPLWRAGLPAKEIATQTGLGRNQIYDLARVHPDRLPPRERGTAPIQRTQAALARAAKPVPAEEAAKRPERLDPPAKADAFRPLPGTRAALLWDACGCRWPVHVDGADPMQNTTLFVCDAVPAIKGRTQDGRPIPAPYCATHVAMAQGETEWRRKREARDARRAA